MKLKLYTTMSLAFCVFSNNLLQAQGFNSGSNGSYGALNISTSQTVQLPPNGILHCTTVSIKSGGILTFSRNALNTPVYILATGDVTITGRIWVTGEDSSSGKAGRGGPGGFDGGPPGFAAAGIKAGPGRGPGGGQKGQWLSSTDRTHAGSGSFKLAAAAGVGAGAVYGSHLLIPLIGGSGGGGGQGSTSTSYGGGGGGGAILIASNTKIVFTTNGVNQIFARGGNPYYDLTASSVSSGAGSGGAVRLVAPVIQGSASVDVGGGFNSVTSGGNGRFRVDALDQSGFNSFDIDSRGSMMVIFPTPISKLSIASAAGTTISENATGQVTVLLPVGSDPNQTIQVRARDFGGVVPIRVRLVPESGDATTFDATIDNTVNNPATTNVPVTLPINTGVRIEVFTR